MPNIKQQERRVKRAARERLENLRWRSTARTLERRLQAAVADGDTARAAEEERALVRWLDKAAARRAIHPNRAARKKAQAARLAASGDR
jgi:small subunit ribosomal protein S20